MTRLLLIYTVRSFVALYFVVCSLTVLFSFSFSFFLCIARTCKGVMANKLIIMSESISNLDQKINSKYKLESKSQFKSISDLNFNFKK